MLSTAGNSWRVLTVLYCPPLGGNCQLSFKSCLLCRAIAEQAVISAIFNANNKGKISHFHFFENG